MLVSSAKLKDLLVSFLEKNFVKICSYYSSDSSHSHQYAISGSNFLMTSIESSTSQIVDSSANDQMLHVSHLIITFKQYTSNKKVQTAECTFVTVAGIGSIHLEPIGSIAMPSMSLTFQYLESMQEKNNIKTDWQCDDDIKTDLILH